MATPITIGLLSLCVACGADNPVEPPTSPPDPDPDGDGILTVDDRCPNEAENFNNYFDGDGCPDIPSHYYPTIRWDVERMWAELFTAAQVTYTPITQFQAYTQPISTPCGVLPMFDAFYCALDWGVYYDDNMVTDLLLIQYGDAAPGFVFSHEIGHHVGYQLGLWPPSISDKQGELMADCFAGVWLASVAGTEFLEIADADEAVARMLADGDPTWPWFSPNEHGTVEQRQTAVGIGVLQGADGCTSQELINLFPVEEQAGLALVGGVF
jgi:predicted metalloprotease